MKIRYSTRKIRKNPIIDWIEELGYIINDNHGTVKTKEGGYRGYISNGGIAYKSKYLGFKEGVTKQDIKEFYED